MTASRRSRWTALTASLMTLAVTGLLAGPAVADFTTSQHSTNTEEATKELENHKVGVPPDNPERSIKVANGGVLGGSPQAVVAADFDGDGQDDLAAATRNRFGPREASSRPHGVAVLLSAPDGTYRRPVNYVVGAAERHTGTSVVPDPLAEAGEQGIADLAVADVNGDSSPDLVAANRGSDSVAILINTGAGTFVADPPARLSNSETGSVTLPARYPTGTRPESVAAADLDGDGDQDLATANSGSNDVSVLVNDGNGRYQPAGTSPHAVGTAPHGLTLADLDGDGDRDVATANRDSDDVSVLLNDGSAGLTAEADSPYKVDGNSVNDSKPVDVVAATLGTPDSSPNDGDLDLATANQGTDKVSVLVHDGALDDGNTSFTPESNSPYPVGADPVALAVGNLDPDASSSDVDPDLVTANRRAESLTVLHNTP